MGQAKASSDSGSCCSFGCGGCHGGSCSDRRNWRSRRCGFGDCRRRCCCIAYSVNGYFSCYNSSGSRGSCSNGSGSNSSWTKHLLLKVFQKTGKEMSTDKPSWVNRSMVDPTETAHQNATRILNDKYGIEGWKVGPRSEYNIIVKWLIRSLGLK